MDSPLLPSSDADVKTLLEDSGVILTADWASAGKQRVQTRSERACALLWAPPFGAVGAPPFGAVDILSPGLVSDS